MPNFPLKNCHRNGEHYQEKMQGINQKSRRILSQFISSV